MIDGESRLGRGLRTALTVLALLLLGLGVFSRAGMTRGLAGGWARRLSGREQKRILRVWDWWSPSTNEKYAAYFRETEAEFERLHPDVDVVYQFVPFGQYEQKMATGLVGKEPPDLFQSSVYWAEGFYDRGMLRPFNDFLERDRADREGRRQAGLPIDPGEVVDEEAFLESAWRHNTKLDGTVFGIPQILDSNCLIWNLDILEKAAGEDEEIRAMFVIGDDGQPDYARLRFEAVRDWAQFRRIVKKLSVHGPDGSLRRDAHGEPVQAGFGIHAHGSGAGPFMPWCAANGANFQDAAGTQATFANDSGEEALQFVLDLYWKDKVSPPFRRQMTDYEVFQQRRIACMVGGTWSGKYIVRNTEGWEHFSKTPFPPGPHGDQHTTQTWGNMLVMSRRCKDPDLAWEYIKFICSLEGARRLLRTIEQNSPRRDAYEGEAWSNMVLKHPYLENVPAICASGIKLRHTQINAVDHAVKPVFESILLRYPEIERGVGPYPSVRAGLQAAADGADRVYDRYNAQVAYWRQNGLVAR